MPQRSHNSYQPALAEKNQENSNINPTFTQVEASSFLSLSLLQENLVE